MDSSCKTNFEISLQQLIEKLHILFSEDHVNADEVRQVMEAYQSKYSDWKKYANFDPHRYVLSVQRQPFARVRKIALLRNLAEMVKNRVLRNFQKSYFKKHFCLVLHIQMYVKGRKFRALS